MPAPLKLRINKALDVVGPQCFGYRALYIPLEKFHFFEEYSVETQETAIRYLLSGMSS
jgi:hypothetical protein